MCFAHNPFAVPVLQLPHYYKRNAFHFCPSFAAGMDDNRLQHRRRNSITIRNTTMLPAMLPPRAVLFTSFAIFIFITSACERWRLPSRQTLPKQVRRVKSTSFKVIARPVNRNGMAAVKWLSGRASKNDCRETWIYVDNLLMKSKIAVDFGRHQLIVCVRVSGCTCTRIEKNCAEKLHLCL